MGVFLTVGACLATPAYAVLPDPVQEMIDAAMASGDEESVNTVVKFAKQLHPDFTAAIDAQTAAFFRNKSEEKALAAAEAKKAASAEAEAAELAESRNGFFDNWSGKGELGGFRTTGNTDNTGLSASLNLKRENEKWVVKLGGYADYQETENITTKEQYRAFLEGNYKFNQRFYAYALTQYEKDSFQGFNSRWSVSAGLGYRVIDEETITLDMKGGPAWRHTDFTDGTSDSQIAVLGSLDFDWKISDTLKFTEDASMYLESGNKSFTSTTGLEAKLMEKLTGRLSYTWEHETDPPIGRRKTDTISRITLIYDF